MYGFALEEQMLKKREQRGPDRLRYVVLEYVISTVHISAFSCWCVKAYELLSFSPQSSDRKFFCLEIQRLDHSSNAPVRSDSACLTLISEFMFIPRLDQPPHTAAFLPLPCCKYPHPILIPPFFSLIGSSAESHPTACSLLSDPPPVSQA